MLHKKFCKPAEFLCALLSPCTPPDEVLQLRQIAAGGELDWAAIAALANQSGLAPALYTALESTGISAEAPKLMQDYLQEIYRFNLSRNDALLEQLREVVLLLNGAGVAPLLLKGGAALAMDLYQDPGMRFMWDLDLLVPEDQLELSAAALKAAGYEVPLKYRSMAATTTGHHYPVLVRPGDPAGVELHRSVMRSGGGLLDSGAIWREARPYGGCRLAGGVAVVMSPTDEVIYCFAHSELLHTQHHRHERIDIRHLQQFAFLICRYRDEVDWKRLENLIHHPAFGQVFVRYIYLAEQLFRVVLPLSIDHDPDMERYYQMLTTPVSKQGRLCRLLRVAGRDLLWAFSGEHLRELYQQQDDPVLRLRLRHIKVLIGRYWQPGAFLARFRMFMD